MRHRVYGKHLGRNKDERDTLFKGLAKALFTHGTIQISESKAKAVKGLIDKIINLAKDKQKENQLQSFLTDNDLRDRLIKDIVPKLGKKTSGFTRIIRIGTRLGDQTTMVKMSLIGAEQLSVPSSRLSDKGKPVARLAEASAKRVSKSVTDKQRTEKPKSEKRKVKKTTSRSKK